MAKGTRYTPEFKAKAVRLLAESRSSYSSETNAISAVAKDLGIAPESLRRWRNQSDATVAEETRQSAEDAMAELKKLRAENAQLRRANEILTTASAFFRGQARPGTALKAACIDAYRGRFGGRADLPGAVGRAGLRFPDRPRLPRLQDEASQPHGGAPRGIGA